MSRIRISRTAIWMVVLPLLMGMGDLKEHKSPGEIPVPDLNFQAVVTDSGGIVARLTHVSLDGRTYIVGKKGNATVTMDFDKINEMVFVSHGDKLSATVKLKGGLEEKIDLESSAVLTGRTQYGTYQIESKDIRVLKIKGAETR